MVIMLIFLLQNNRLIEHKRHCYNNDAKKQLQNYTKNHINTTFPTKKPTKTTRFYRQRP